jgi:lambda family phage portal protein
MNILDRMIAAVSPERAARRQTARLKLAGLSRMQRSRMHYDGATTSHRSGGWRPTNTDANAEIRVAGERLRNVAREMVRNNPFASRAKSVIATNVVGAGIIPTIETPNRASKRRLEALLRAHFDTPSCDYMGRTDLYGLQALAMATLVEAGEVLIRKRSLPAGSGAALPFQIQVMEPDYLDTLRDGPLPGGNTAIQGVEYDASGRVVAYHLFNEHPGTSYPASIVSERVPAEYILHVFRQERPGQARGVTWFAPVIMTLRDFSDYSEAQLMRQKISACFTAFVTSDDPESVGVDETDAGTPLQTFEPGTIERLRAGESVEFGAPPPITDYDAYSRVTLRSIAAGLGVSYEALTGDLSGVNFSSGRMGWIEFQRSIDSWRNHMLVPQMLYPIGKWFLDSARIVEGVSGSPTIKWTPPRREMISPRDEVPFAVEAIRAGLITRSEFLRKAGYDPNVVDAELAADNARADALGLVLDSDARKRTSYGLNPDPNVGGGKSAGNDNETNGDERRYN